uniref:Chromo-red fluorescent GFP-like protein n=1 Tax=Echinopora forskaliana TaxID=526284 RepID=B6CTZ7_9CNID|nr:chromo-red fluorescent GFP-like protein [Echinopora forskaliana]
MSVIKQVMKTKLHLEGTVNGHDFTIEGKGEGKPYEGLQHMKMTVTKGAPLPFSVHILTPSHMYGSKPFNKYPADIPDYHKQSFPEGMSWERSMIFEDGGVCTASNHSSINLQENCFIYDVKFHGVNLPPDGPVMQKTIAGWEPSVETLYVRDGMLKSDTAMVFKLKGGGHHRVDFKTTYKAKKPVKLPEFHFVEHRLELTKHDKDFTTWDQQEAAEGHFSPLPKALP